MSDTKLGPSVSKPQPKPGPVNGSSLKLSSPATSLPAVAAASASAGGAPAQNDQKASTQKLGEEHEWYLFMSSLDPPQLYRNAPTEWPIGAEELNLTEREAASGNPIALNNLGLPVRVRLD
jgi:hypothetical protein